MKYEFKIPGRKKPDTPLHQLIEGRWSAYREMCDSSGFASMFAGKDAEEAGEALSLMLKSSFMAGYAGGCSDSTALLQTSTERTFDAVREILASDIETKVGEAFGEDG